MVYQVEKRFTVGAAVANEALCLIMRWKKGRKRGEEREEHVDGRRKEYKIEMREVIRFIK